MKFLSDKVKKIRIGISSCLAGLKVRYDGRDKQDHYLTDTLGSLVEFIAVCPEVESGLPVPREPMQLIGNLSSPRIVTIETNIDKTDILHKWIDHKIKALRYENLCGFIFKSGSPSCGIRDINIYNLKTGSIKKGNGLFANAFIKTFPAIPVEDEERLHKPDIRENFIERIVCYKEWTDLKNESKGIKNLIEFHAFHKYHIMSHSQKDLKYLGNLLANRERYTLSQLYNEYERIYLEALKKLPTIKRHYNVLLHIMGYLKKQLSKGEKQKLLEVIDKYRNKELPLVYVIALFDHYAKRFNLEYLKNQYYLNPQHLWLMIKSL